MEQEWTKALKDAISEVFSTMFFIVLMEDQSILDEAGDLDAEGWYEGWLEMSLPPTTAKVWTWTPPGVVGELASNFMSLDPSELDQEALLDAYREALNMVAGKLLTTVDNQGSWKMGLPQARVLPAGGLQAYLDQADQCFSYDAEDRPVLLGLSIQNS